MIHKIKFIGTIIAISLMILFIAAPVKTSAEWKGVSGYCTGEGGSCTLCDGFAMVKGALDWLTAVSVSLAMLTVLVAGVMYVFGGVDQGLTNKAKDILRNAVIGMGAIFFAWLIINTIMLFAGISSASGVWNPAGWFTIICK